MPVLIACLLVGWSQPLAPLDGASPSYRRVLTAEERREFYRCGGRNHLAERVHLHVEASLLRRGSDEIDLGAERKVLRFKNGSVPLLISPRNRDYVRLLRRLDRARVLCVKGRVIRAPDSPQRCCLLVEKIKRTPARLE